MKIYLAGPIFNERDRMYLDYLYDRIVKVYPNADIYVPHRNKAINDKTKCATSYDIYWGDYNRLKETDLLIAVVSGDTPPIGTTCEIGIFTQMIDADPRKKLVALCDDCREGFVTCANETVAQQKLEALRKEPGENQMSYINIFLTGAIKTHGKLAVSADDLIEKLTEIKGSFEKTEAELEFE